MTSSRRTSAAGAAAMLLCAFVFANTAGSQAQEPEGNFGVGIPERLSAQVSGLSRAATRQRHSRRDAHSSRLRQGTVDIVHKHGGGGGHQSPVWRIQRQPERADAAPDLHRVARRPDRDRSRSRLCPIRWSDWSHFWPAGPSTLLTGLLPLNLPLGFTIDRVAVVPGAPVGHRSHWRQGR